MYGVYALSILYKAGHIIDTQKFFVWFILFFLKILLNISGVLVYLHILCLNKWLFVFGINPFYYKTKNIFLQLS